MEKLNEPIISVVMPSYNHERYINDAISSVISQGIRNLELIIIDDFSSDGSRRIIREWVAKDKRIKAILHDKNEGIARTTNEGIKAAQGKYVALMASDDMFKQSAFEKVIAVLEASKKLGAALLDGEYIDHRNRGTGVLFSDMHRKPSTGQGSFFKDLATGNFVCTGVVRRSFIEKYQIFFNEKLKYLNDWLFWLDLSNVCDFVFINEPLYYYRIHRTNTSLKYRNDMRADDGLRAIDIVLRKYGEILDNKSKVKLLHGKGRSYITLRDYEHARECFYQGLQLSSASLDDVKLSFYILFTYFPSLFGHLVDLRSKLKDWRVGRRNF
ncbi:MAG: glycosyltransferase family 2 protein [Candidatus Bathyarchaeales archaeon]